MRLVPQQKKRKQIPMIILFIGTVGSGKTLSMTWELYQYYCQGYQIYTNYRLKFPKLPGCKEPILLTKKLFDKMIKEKHQLQNAVLGLDEIHIWIDSRGSMEKKRKGITYFILQTRKRNVRLLASTQHPHQVDKRLRDSVDILSHCRNLTNQSSIVKDPKIKTYIMQESVFQWKEGMKPKGRILFANPIYPLFDTTEMIDMDEEEE